MVDFSTLDMASLIFNGWTLSLFLAWALFTTGSATHYSSVVPSLTFKLHLARSSFSLGWAGFFLESLFFGALFSIFSWLHLLNIQAGISPPWSSSLSLSLLPPLFLALTPAGSWLTVWVWQHLSCSSHVSNNHRVNRRAHTHITLQCPL